MDTTTRITDLPENISIQMPAQHGMAQQQYQPSHIGGLPSTNTRTEYDTQNPSYKPLNIHQNPYGNSIQPDVMPLPQPKYQVPPQQGMMDSTPDPLAELHSMPHVRLPSRDIPMDQTQYQTDEEIQANYIPSKPKLTKDYVREYEEAATRSAKKHEKTKRQSEQIEDAMTDFQLPILVALLFFLFQIPIFHTVMYRYMGSLPLFSTDGNLNFYGILFKSLLFGSCFWSLQRLIHMIS